MAWPLATDYSSAIQNPAGCFADAELAGGRPETDLLGLPLSFAGNFANVYKVVCPGEQAWAVKCFTREVPDLQQRYALISDHLEKNRRRFAVEFRYLEQGVKVRGAWYPILKMRWVEGFTLNDFLREHAGNANLLEQLGGLWLRLATEMRESRLGHGDIQHGNVLLVPGTRASAMVLRLIDYDGMWVPALAGHPPGEVGHPNYQHPQRLREGGYSAEVDRFAHLVVFTALRCLAAGGRALWERHDNGENLLFREVDFRQPAQSKLWPELLRLPDPGAAALAAHLLTASRRPLDQVPLLADLVTEGFALSDDLRGMVGELVPWAPHRRAHAAPAPDWLRDAVRHNPDSGRRSPVEAVPEVVPAVDDTALSTAIDETLLHEPLTEQRLRPPRPAVPVVLSEARPADWPVPPPLPLQLLPQLTAPLRKPRPRFLVSDWLQALGLSPDSLIVRFWPLFLGLLLGLPLVVLVVWLMWPVPRHPRPRPPAVPPQLQPARPIEVRAGHGATLDLVVDRPDLTPPLKVRFAGLPPGLNRPELEVPAGIGPARVQALFSANLDVREQSAPVTVSLWRGEEKVAEQVVQMTTRRFLRPELDEVSPIQLLRGETLTLVVPVKANGNTDPWTLAVDLLPKDVTAAPPRDGVPPGTVGVQLTAAGNGRSPQVEIVHLVLRAGGLEADRKMVSLSIATAGPRAAVELTLPASIRIRAGRTTRARVQVRRSDYDGAVWVQVPVLPAGVRVPRVHVAIGEDSADLEFRADRDVVPPPLNPVIRVQALVGDRPLGEKECFLEIQPAEAR